MRERHGWVLDASQVRESTDVNHGLQAVLNVATRPGDGVVVHTPACPPFLETIARRGRRLHPVPYTPDGDRWTFDPDRLDRERGERPARMLPLANPHDPHNPTGEPDTFGVAATLAGRRDGDAWLAELMPVLRRNAQSLREELPPGVRYRVPEAAFLARLDFRELEPDTDPRAFFLKKARVLLNDGRTSGAEGEGFVRVDFGTSERILREILHRLRNALASGRRRFRRPGSRRVSRRPGQEPRPPAGRAVVAAGVQGRSPVRPPAGQSACQPTPRAGGLF
ncbi:aminotransferase class I/II-fold pyridoxal phosphate-dependent enzyme [Streptomyces sp. NPDC052727]|uniref:aminotransferase class I/II-fold pyridoxal phosphate-dependent enzyme n=1 Tax=Streptomyces sp. NPDC052727 TaxID=3154854 RepID=UPI00341E8E5C